MDQRQNYSSEFRQSALENSALGDIIGQIRQIEPRQTGHKTSRARSEALRNDASLTEAGPGNMRRLADRLCGTGFQ